MTWRRFHSGPSILFKETEKTLLDCETVGDVGKKRSIKDTGYMSGEEEQKTFRKVLVRSLGPETL